MSLAAGDISRDRFLGGKVAALQPAKGRHRAGTDAVLLAAAVPRAASGVLVDLGAGVGVAGLCAARLCPDAEVVLVDKDPVAADLARQSRLLEENADIAARVRVIESDLLAPQKQRVDAGLLPGMAAQVIMNPPFYEPGSVCASPDEARAAAHVLSDEGLEGWMRVAASLLAGDGRVTVIWPAARLAALLSAIEGRFGAATVYPLFPKVDAAALRVIVCAVKGSRAPLRLLPGMVLHEADGGFTTEADRAMREGALDGFPDA